MSDTNDVAGEMLDRLEKLADALEAGYPLEGWLLTPPPVTITDPKTGEPVPWYTLKFHEHTPPELREQMECAIREEFESLDLGQIVREQARRLLLDGDEGEQDAGP